MCFLSRTCADVNVLGYVNVCLSASVSVSVSVGGEIRKGTMSQKEGSLRDVGEENVRHESARWYDWGEEGKESTGRGLWGGATGNKRTTQSKEYMKTPE